MSAPIFLHAGSDGVLSPHPIGFLDLTNEAYQSSPGVSKSMLDSIAISPLNFWDQYINPKREPRAYKHAFAVGDGTHKLVLEPGTFEDTYAVGFDRSLVPDALATIDDLKQFLNARGQHARGSKPELIRMVQEEDPTVPILAVLEAEHNARQAGKLLMSAVDYKDMLSMLQAIQMHHTAGPLLQGAYTEQSFFWQDAMGVLRRCRTDAITWDGRFVVDLKTTEDVSPAGFGRSIAQRRYHVRAAWYLDILQALYGSDAPTGWAILAAQKKRPHDVVVHELTDDHIRLGRLLYQRDLALMLECQQNNRWPGSDGGLIIAAQLPEYNMRTLYDAELAA